MQKDNINKSVTVTGRHVEVTDAIREFAVKKIEGIHLDYPKIIEAKVIVDVQRNRQIAEIILFCTDNITIEASTSGDDLYASIDETVTKIMRRMRKHKTRLMKRFRPHRAESIRHLEEEIYTEDVLDYEAESPTDPDPVKIHREGYELRTMYKEDAIMDLELSCKPFILFRSARRNVLQIVYRRPDGAYSIIELGESL